MNCAVRLFSQVSLRVNVRNDNKKSRSRRLTFSSIHQLGTFYERLEERIVPAFVSGDFGWAVSQVNLEGKEVNTVLAGNSHPAECYMNPDPNVRLTTDNSGFIYEATTSVGSMDFNTVNGSNIITSAGDRDLVLVKMAANGSPVWIRQWKNPNNSTLFIHDVINQGNGSIAIVGSYTGSFDFDPSDLVSLTKTSAGKTDGFAMLIGSDGTFQGVRTYGGLGNDVVASYMPDSNGNIYVAGTFEGAVQFDSASNGTLTSSDTTVNISWSQPNNTFFLKYASNGSFQWVKNFQGTSYMDRMMIDSSNNLILLSQYSTGCDFDPGPGTSYFSAYGLALVKLNPDGNLITVSRINSSWPDGQHGFGLASDSNGDFIVSGNVFFGFYPPATGFFVHKFNSNLQEQWRKEFSLANVGSNHPPTAFVNVDSLDNIILAGYFNSSFDIDPSANVAMLNAIGQDDLFVAKFDKDMNYQASSVMGGTGFDRAFCASLSPTGSLVMGGIFSGTADFDPSSGSANLSTDLSLANAHSRFVLSLSNVGQMPGFVITSRNEITMPIGLTSGMSVIATGGPVQGFSITSGSLPAGVTLDPATGLLSGTPAAGTAGTYPVTIQAANGAGAPASQNLTLNIISTVTSFVVSKGQAQRSYVRYLDLGMDSNASALLLKNNLSRIRLTRATLEGNGSTSVSLAGFVSVTSGSSTVAIDFGTVGLGNSRNTNTADGYYTLGLDLDGNGSYETSLNFDRLFGDTNGDGQVTSADQSAVQAACYQAYNVVYDTNGDGLVNSTDFQ